MIYTLLWCLEKTVYFDKLFYRESESVKMNTERLVKAVGEANQDKFPVLEHPGKIFHLKKREECEEEMHFLHKCQSKMFTESLLLVDNMILDHLHTSYEAVMNHTRL